MKTIVITAYADEAPQIEALKKVIKDFKIKYRISKSNAAESPYNPDFVAMIRQGEKDLKKGKGIKVSLAELEELCK